MSNNWFFTADWHLNHCNIIKYCNRPFFSSVEKGLFDFAKKGTIPLKEVRISQESVEAMNAAIIDSTNEVVGLNDNLVILGDFCFTPKGKREEIVKSLRRRIKCKNLFLVLGNHDNKNTLLEVTSQVFHQYTFNIHGQSIFASHYPCRSWNKASHGSWMLYGHVHNLFFEEDNGELMPYKKRHLKNGFQDILLKNNINDPQIVQQLLNVVAELNGVDLTLDVGVDNVLRENVSFGTPWSFEEIRHYMAPKIEKWRQRKESFKDVSFD